MTAKPDCTGQRFGKLLVLRKSTNRNKRNKTLWILQCDCGQIVERVRHSFDRRGVKNPSCGCAKSERASSMALAKAKPDCTGAHFGYLTVLEKAEIIKDKGGKSRRLWLVECICGKQFKTARGNFDRAQGGQKSCGCMKYKSPNLGVKPQQLSGQRFGNLVAIAIVPETRAYKGDNSKVWLCQCDCGRRIKKSVKQLHWGYSLHCGIKNDIHIPYSNYPPAPIPYPEEAGRIFIKYLPLTKQSYWNELQWGDIANPRHSYNAETEDERRDRLERAAWIITYRRSQGEVFSELREKRFIRKHLRYAQTDVYWRHKFT